MPFGDVTRLAQYFTMHEDVGRRFEEAVNKLLGVLKEIDWGRHDSE